MMILARDPRTALPLAKGLTLAARLADPATARYCLVACMPPHNGIEEPLAAVAGCLVERYPRAVVAEMMRRDFMIDDPQERAEIAACADAVILFTGPAATSVHATWAYATALERQGLPTCITVFEELAGTADWEAEIMAAPLRRVIVPADADHDAGRTFADQVINALTVKLSDTGSCSAPPFSFAPDQYLAADDEAALRDRFARMGLTDGLPIVLPTEALVTAMLSGTSRAPSDIVTPTLRPQGVPVCVEQIAINAVMAGAAPIHLPIILTAISQFGAVELDSMTRSVNSFGFLLLVNGPYAQSAGLDGGVNAMGAANPANAPIVRALRLVLQNCGWLRYGVNSTPAQGSPVGICLVAENEAASPWPGLHLSLGYDENESVVTLFTGAFTVAGNFYYRGIDALPAQMRLFDSWSGALLLLSAKRAEELAAQGHTRASIEQYLWQHTTAPLREIRQSGFYPMIRALIARAPDGGLWPAEYLTRPDEDEVPLFPARNVKVAVVGGRVSSVMQVWNTTLQSHRSITEWA